MAVNDVVIQPKTPATGSEQGNQSNVFYNIKVNGILYIPVVGAPTFNGGKVQDGAMVLSNYVLHIYADGEWKSYVTLEYAEANFAMLNDGLLEVGDITLAGLNVTIVAPVKWRIDGVNYEKLTNTVIAIVPATADYNRIDLIYATTAGTILKIQGTETLGVAVEPTLPANTIRVAPVYINGSTVAPPAPDLSTYAIDANVLHKTGDETKSGSLTLSSGKLNANSQGVNIGNVLGIFSTGSGAGASASLVNSVGGDINLQGYFGNFDFLALKLSQTPSTDASPTQFITRDASTGELKKTANVVQLNPSSPQSGDVSVDGNIITNNLTANNSISAPFYSIQENGTMQAEAGSRYNFRDRANYNVGDYRFYLDTDGKLKFYRVGFTPTFPLLPDGIIAFDGNKIEAGGIKLLTTPETDATPANILTWDATTKEVKKVGVDVTGGLASFDNAASKEAVFKDYILKENVAPNVKINNVKAKSAATFQNTPTYDGSGIALHPSIYFNPNGYDGYKYWMAMTPYKNSSQIYENPSILCSNDGSTWINPTGITNPIVTIPSNPDNYFLDTEIIPPSKSIDGKMRVMYIYYELATDKITTFSRTISNGVVGAQVTVLPAQSPGMVSPSVVEKDGIYTMYYIDWSTNPHSLKKRTSTNPDSGWSAPVDCTVTNTTGFDLWHVSANLYNGEVHLWITTCAFGTLSNAPTQLYFAQSNDGVNFVMGDNNIGLGTETGWDYKDNIYRASAILLDGATKKYGLWYSAGNDVDFSDIEWHIGYTEVSISGDGLQEITDVNSVTDKAITTAGLNVNGIIKGNANGVNDVQMQGGDGSDLLRSLNASGNTYFQTGGENSSTIFSAKNGTYNVTLDFNSLLTRFNGSVRASSNDGTSTAVVRNSDLPAYSATLRIITTTGTPFTKATLNSTYPSSAIGTKVICTTLGIVYEKYDATNWYSTNITIMP